MQLSSAQVWWSDGQSSLHGSHTRHTRHVIAAVSRAPGVTCHVSRGGNTPWDQPLTSFSAVATFILCLIVVMKLKWFQGCCYIHTLRHWGFVICNVKCSARCNLRRKECKNDLHKNRVVTRVLCRGNPAWHHISSHWQYTQKPYAHILEIKDVILNVCPQSLL